MKSRLVRYTFLMSLMSLAACGGGGGGEVGAVPATNSSDLSYTSPTTTTAPTQPVDATPVAPTKWGAPVLLQSSADWSSPWAADVAFDLNGNALAVWQYSGNIWASRYDAATKNWSTAVTISDVADIGNIPKIAFDSKGNAMAVWEWQSRSSSEQHIGANYYSVATGSWGTPTVIDVADGGASYDVDLAFDGNGNAMVVWDKPSGVYEPVSVWYNRYDAAAGVWGTPGLIDNDNVNTASRPEIAVAPNGDALAIWEQRDGARNNVMFARYAAATTSWGTPALLEFQDLGDAWSPDIAMDPNGNAIAVWEQDNGTTRDAVARRYIAASGTWDAAPVILENLEDDVSYVRIVLDANGNALALWMQAITLNGTPSIFSTRYDAATGSWSTAAVIENSNYTSIYPELSIGANGNAMAIWEERTTGNQVANYYDATTQTWGVAAPVETSSDPANYGAVAVAPDGSAVAIWTQSNALWASHYQQ